MECPIPQRNELPLTGEYGAARILSGRGAIRGSSIRSPFELDEPEGILPRVWNPMIVLVTPYFSFILKILLFFINVLYIYREGLGLMK